MEEIRKDVVWFENNYQVSSIGRVRTKDRMLVDPRGNRYLKKWGHIMKLRKIDWYPAVNISKNDKKSKVLVHRLIWEAFIPNPECKATINHKNGIRDDNRLENLEWNTYKENTAHSIDVLKRWRSSWPTHVTSKAIYQYDKDGNFIKEWSYIKEAINCLWCTGAWCCANGRISSSWWYVRRFYKKDIISTKWNDVIEEG